MIDHTWFYGWCSFAQLSAKALIWKSLFFFCLVVGLGRFFRCSCPRPIMAGSSIRHGLKEAEACDISKKALFYVKLQPMINDRVCENMLLGSTRNLGQKHQQKSVYSSKRFWQNLQRIYLFWISWKNHKIQIVASTGGIEIPVASETLHSFVAEFYIVKLEEYVEELSEILQIQASHNFFFNNLQSPYFRKCLSALSFCSYEVVSS